MNGDKFFQDAFFPKFKIVGMSMEKQVVTMSLIPKELPKCPHCGGDCSAIEEAHAKETTHGDAGILGCDTIYDVTYRTVKCPKCNCEGTEKIGFHLGSKESVTCDVVWEQDQNKAQNGLQIQFF